MFAGKSIIALAVALLAVINSVSAQYLQVSSTVKQTLAPLGKGKGLTYNSIDAQSGVTFASGGSVFTIVTAGAYFLIAAPQVGYGGCTTQTAFTADFWVVVNGVAVANSNIRMSAVKAHKDVIVTQGVYIFAKGDKVSVFGSGTCAIAEYIKPTGEPAIPSIITTLFKI